MTTKMVHKSGQSKILSLKCPGDPHGDGSGCCMGEDAPGGYLKAVFCWFGEEDKDGDIIHAGAVGNQNVWLSAFGHTSWRGELPIGKGRVYEEGNKAVFEGHFNMAYDKAADTYSTMEFAPELMEFSWGFDITEYTYTDNGGSAWDRTLNIYKTTIYEVSPVLVGAGNNTGVEMLKARDVYAPPHLVTDETIASPAIVKARLALAKNKLRPNGL